MPEKKGRRRRPRGRRRDARAGREGAEPVPPSAAAPAPRRAAAEPALPALRVRYAGFVVAMLTLMIGILTVADAFVVGRSGTDLALRFGAGSALIVLALAIAVLALFPGRVRAWLRRE